MADFALLESLPLISRKIWVIESPVISTLYDKCIWWVNFTKYFLKIWYVYDPILSSSLLTNISWNWFTSLFINGVSWFHIIFVKKSLEYTKFQQANVKMFFSRIFFCQKKIHHSKRKVVGSNPGWGMIFFLFIFCWDLLLDVP